MKKKTAILLVNLGTPDSPKVKDVRKYLFEFLNDPRVIDLPWLGRKLLVNGIIVPFRAPKSAKIYKELWEEWNGESPLLTYGYKLRDEVKKHFPEDEVMVELAMRYQNPSMESVLAKIRDWNPDEIIILPLFPHYASSTNGSAMDKAMRIIRKWWVVPEVKMIAQFWDHPSYINTFVKIGKSYKPEEYDHVLFSFHGLPERHVDKVYFDNRPCSDHHCEDGVTEESKFCYKAACYESAKRIAAGCGIPEDKYEVCFQSRLGKTPWLEPYSDKVIEKLAKDGMKKLLVFSPAFVADCLETTVEIGVEYQEIFEEHGGEKIQLVRSLNDDPDFVEGVVDILRARM